MRRFVHGRRAGHAGLLLVASALAVALPVGIGRAAPSAKANVHEFVNVFPLSATSKRILVYSYGTDEITRFRFRGEGGQFGFEIVRIIRATISSGLKPQCRLTETERFTNGPKLKTLDCSMRLKKNAKLTVDIEIKPGGTNAGCYDLNHGTPTQTPKFDFGICPGETRGPIAPFKPPDVSAAVDDLKGPLARVTIVNSEKTPVRRFEVDFKGRITKIVSVKIGKGKRSLSGVSADGAAIKQGDIHVERAIPARGGQAVVTFAHTGSTKNAKVHFNIGSGRCPSSRSCERDTIEVESGFDLYLVLDPSSHIEYDVGERPFPNDRTRAGIAMTVIAGNAGPDTSKAAHITGEVTHAAPTGFGLNFTLSCPTSGNIPPLKRGAQVLLCQIKANGGKVPNQGGELTLEFHATPCHKDDRDCDNNDTTGEIVVAVPAPPTPRRK